MVFGAIQRDQGPPAKAVERGELSGDTPNWPPDDMKNWPPH
jgi:hypothetical protein